MAEEEVKAEQPKPSGGGSKKALLLPLINTVLVLAALGTAVYVKMVFKRPAITETQERKKLEAQQKEQTLHASDKGMIIIKPFTVNIASTPREPLPGQTPDKAIEGKLHYATVKMVLAIKDINQQPRFDEIQAVFMDQILELLGKKSFAELTTVQGRYLIKSDIIEIANSLLKEKLITDIFFDQFVVQ